MPCPDIEESEPARSDRRAPQQGSDRAFNRRGYRSTPPTSSVICGRAGIPVDVRTTA